MLKSSFFCFFIGLFLLGSSQTTGYAPSSDGANIHYKIYGKGVPILIINGGAGYSSKHLEPFAKELSEQGYQTILFDRRGTGKSTLPTINETTVTMDKMVSDIEALRTHLKVEKWTVLGFSFGGTYSLFYASKHAAKLNGLLLMSPAGIDAGFASYYLQNQMARLSPQELDSLAYWSTQQSKEAELKKLEFTVRSYVCNPKHIKEVYQVFLSSQYYPDIDGLILKDVFKTPFNLAPNFKKFKKPCMIIAGRQDFLGEGTFIRTNQAIRNSKLVFLNECNHYPWIEQKEAYFKEVNAFMKSLTP
ncbi:MAG: alpha/beta fold hydrolase [Bacteroidia bacterium]